MDATPETDAGILPLSVESETPLVEATPPPAAVTPPPPPLLARVWRLVSGVFVFLIVAWHLFFLVVRNPLDLWDKSIRAWFKQKTWREISLESAGVPELGWWETLAAANALDDAGETNGQLWRRWGAWFRVSDHLTYRFGNGVGFEQNWVMFSPPMARRAPFLGTRYEFTDGSSVTVPSDNEPDPARFFRVGGWQMRKYEDYMMKGIDSEANDEYPMWAAYVRSLARRWQDRNPDDPRELKRIVLIKRYIEFPPPEKPPGVYDPPDPRDVTAFTPDGRLAR